MKTIKSIEITFHESDDRLIYLEMDGSNNITGINYAQGDDIDDFMEKFAYPDELLTKQVNLILPYLNGTLYDNINIAIWMLFELENNL